MKLLVINGNGYSIFPPSGAWFFLSEQGFLAAPFARSPRRSPTSSICISTRIPLPSWRMDANGDYITVFKNIWSELEDNA